MGRITGAILVLAWAAVLVFVIVLRRHTDYASHKELFWWEAFYRTGSIIFGGGQVAPSSVLYESRLSPKIWPHCYEPIRACSPHQIQHLHLQHT